MRDAECRTCGVKRYLYEIIRYTGVTPISRISGVTGWDGEIKLHLSFIFRFTNLKFFIKVFFMARLKEIEQGKVYSFYLGPLHVKALELYKRRRKHRTRTAALRAVLEVVAEAEGLIREESS